MRIPARLTIPARFRRTLVVLGFAALCAVLFGWLWASGGGRIPGVTPAAISLSRRTCRRVGSSRLRAGMLESARAARESAGTPSR